MEVTGLTWVVVAAGQGVTAAVVDAADAAAGQLTVLAVTLVTRRTGAAPPTTLRSRGGTETVLV